MVDKIFGKENLLKDLEMLKKLAETSGDIFRISEVKVLEELGSELVSCVKAFQIKDEELRKISSVKLVMVLLTAITGLLQMEKICLKKKA